MTTESNKPSEQEANKKAAIFTFGEPEQVRGGHISDYVQSTYNGRYYEPPINMTDLYKVYRGSVFHSSAISLKAHIVLSTLEPTKLISGTNFLRFVLDLLVMGNGFVERVENSFGQTLKLKTSPAMKTRVTKDDGFTYLDANGALHGFAKGSIFHLMQPDIKQEIYGIPAYMASILSSELNQESTLFRLRYYRNGSHAGYIIYMTDPAYNETDVDELQKSLKDAKGPGNFKNLFVYAPDGKKDGIQLIPISEVAAKDEFTNIKSITREDELGMHRVPPQLIGIVPSNTGGFGAVGAAAKVFARNEILPLQTQLLELNEWLGEEAFKFKPYEIEGIEADEPKLQ
jgi:PBSX family phage portal protein